MEEEGGRSQEDGKAMDELGDPGEKQNGASDVSFNSRKILLPAENHSKCRPLKARVRMEQGKEI